MAHGDRTKIPLRLRHRPTTMTLAIGFQQLDEHLFYVGFVEWRHNAYNWTEGLYLVISTTGKRLSLAFTVEINWEHSSEVILPLINA